MDRTGTVVHIHIAPDSGEEMVAREAVEAVADRGIRGDRYFDEDGSRTEWGDDPDGEASDITFIEAEAIEAVAADYGIDLDPGEPRRNVTTRDVALNHLVGERFRVGEAVCEGRTRCEPCGYVQSLVGKGNVGEALKHRGGLDARVVESGSIECGDPIEW